MYGIRTAHKAAARTMAAREVDSCFFACIQDEVHGRCNMALWMHLSCTSGRDGVCMAVRGDSVGMVVGGLVCLRWREGHGAWERCTCSCEKPSGMCLVICVVMGSHVR